MTTTDLRLLVRHGEGERLEFKKTLARPLNLARTLAAFANTAGGQVLIGVLDDGRVVGVRDPDEERYMLAQAVALVDPPVALTVSEVAVAEAPSQGPTDAGVVLVVAVAESLRKPHTVAFGPADARVYVRAGATSVQPSARQARVLRHEPGTPQRQAAALPPTRHETAVLALLAVRPRVTVAQVRQLLNLSAKRAEQLLFHLTLAGYLLEHDRETPVFYTRRKH